MTSIQPRGEGVFQHRVLLCLVLTIFLTSIYMLTYSGQIEIADQLDYFDTTGSVVRFGEYSRDLTLFQHPPVDYHFDRPHPFRESVVDKGFPLAAAPLYWLAENTPGFGLVHTTYLFNVFVMAILCAIMFWYVLALGYSETVAVIAALCLGLLSIVWPYTQTFFREPLMMVFLLATALMLEYWRTRRYQALHFLIIALMLLIAAFFSKDAVLLAFPGLIALILPEALWRQEWFRRASTMLLIAALIVSVICAYTGIFGFLSAQPIVAQYDLIPDFAQTAFHTYLFSVGGSLWGTSPILLLGLYGGWLLWKRGEHRLIWGALLVALAFATGYALFRGEHWFGGTVWPQRFLLPVIPFLILPMLPALERLNRRPVLITFVVLALYSLWWQFSGISYRWNAYSEAIFEESQGGLVYWLPGFNDLRHMRPVQLAEFWGVKPLNFAWVRANLPLWPVLFVTLAAFSGGLVYRSLRSRASSWILLTPVLLGGAILWGMLALYPVDPAYRADDQALHQMVEIIRQETKPGDIVMLADGLYLDFFANYGKVGQVHLPVFPYHPGERGSFDQPLERESDNPDVLLADQTAPTVYHLADNHQRLFLLTSGGPEVLWSMRPFERFMGQHYYRVRELRTDADVRMLEYATIDAPDSYSFRSPDTLTDLIYTAGNGETLELVGYSLPSGTTYSMGDALALSLYWHSPQTPTRNYVVTWRVVDMTSGVPVAQGEDTWPGATFKPTTTLAPDVPVWDHRALFLDIPPGEYRLWVLVYEVDDATGVITNLTAEGTEVINGQIGILPVTITVGEG